MTAANIDVLHEESAKEVKSTDNEEIADKSTPLVASGVPDSKKQWLMGKNFGASFTSKILFNLHISRQ